VHLWRVGALADELREQRLTEREKFAYVFTTAALKSVLAPLSFLAGPNRGHLPILMIGSASIMLSGLAYCFRVNQQGDGRYFIERYICLAVPIACRVLLISLSAFIALNAVLAATLGKPAATAFRSSWGAPATLSALIIIAYFGAMQHFIRRVSARPTA